MDFYVLEDDRCRRIADAARGLWAEFLDLNPQFTARSVFDGRTDDQTTGQDRLLLRQPSFPRNECIEAFCRHCSLTMTLLPCLVTNFLSLEHWIPSVEGRPTSWLHELPQSDLVVEQSGTGIELKVDHHILVLVDLEYIVSERPRNLDRVWSALLLHEVGHLVLHWDDFAPQCASGKAMATNQQEAEAWFFQSVIFGLAMGSYAYQRVAKTRRTPGDRHEDAWQFIS